LDPASPRPRHPRLPSRCAPARLPVGSPRGENTARRRSRRSLPFSAAPGLADLSAQVAGQRFYGCSMSYEPNPWCGLDRAFFVNTVTGYRVFVETGWCE
jgi:hypothetical protein